MVTFLFVATMWVFSIWAIVMLLQGGKLADKYERIKVEPSDTPIGDAVWREIVANRGKK